LTRRAEFRVVGLTEREVRERTRRGSSPRAGLLIATLSALAILYAYGQAGPSVEVVPRVDFGDQRVGVPGHTETIRVTNHGPSTLDIDAVALEGFHLDDFVVSTSACVDPLIEPGGECDIEVRFAPKGEGPRSAQLVIVDDLTYDHEAQRPSVYHDLVEAARRTATVYVGFDQIAEIAANPGVIEPIAAQTAEAVARADPS
jgi:hypothetical protein